MKGGKSSPLVPIRLNPNVNAGRNCRSKQAANVEVGFEGKGKVNVKMGERGGEHAAAREVVSSIFERLVSKGVQSKGMTTKPKKHISKGDSTGKTSTNRTIDKHKMTHKHLTKRPANIEEDMGLNKSGRKHTPDGLPIYSVEELKIGKGGGTALCPFDCNCCF